MKQFFLIIISIFLIYSCNNEEKPKQQDINTSFVQTDINSNKDSVLYKLEKNKKHIYDVPEEIHIYKKCQIERDTDIFFNDFFPFDFKNFNTEKLKKRFDSSVEVDSIKKNNNGYIYWIYKFKNKNSYMNFLVKKDKTDPYYYIDEALLNDNFFKSKNGIKINMNRDDFFKTIKTKKTDCDTFSIQEGDLYVYYRFIFKKDSLKSIWIYAEE